MTVLTDTSRFRRWQKAGNADISFPAANVRIITSGGRSIPAHYSVLAAASPVLESMLDRSAMKRRNADGNDKIIHILGVPCGAIEAFVGFLYSTRWVPEEKGVGTYAMHLLVLSHVYRVGRLKRACEAALSERLTAEVVVDVLQLARLCDAPRLYLRCMGVVARDFAAVERTEAWGFVQAHDPWLELDILQFLHDADLVRYVSINPAAKAHRLCLLCTAGATYHLKVVVGPHVGGGGSPFLFCMVKNYSANLFWPASFCQYDVSGSQPSVDPCELRSDTAGRERDGCDRVPRHVGKRKLAV